MLFAGLWVWAGAVPEKGRKDTKFRPIDVNMDSIRVNIQNPRSNYYYKRLWRKYQSNDTNMSLKEYRHLYLGYVFSEDYDPLSPVGIFKKIQPLYYKKHHTPAECDTIIKYAELSLADDPFDLEADGILHLCAQGASEIHPCGNHAVASQQSYQGNHVDRHRH